MRDEKYQTHVQMILLGLTTILSVAMGHWKAESYEAKDSNGQGVRKWRGGEELSGKDGQRTTTGASEKNKLENESERQ